MFKNRKRIIGVALAGTLGIALMSGAGGSGCAPEPSGNTAQKGPGAGKPKVATTPMHVRLKVTWKSRAIVGILSIWWSDPESTDRKDFSVKDSGHFNHDATLPGGDGIVATVHQRTGGSVSCWYVEITPTGGELDRISPIETMTTAGHDLECNYFHPEGPVD